MSDERIQALEGLLTHPGFQLFTAYCREQWGAAGYGRRVKQAVHQAMADKADVAATVSAVDYANDEINRLLTWPSEELKRLQDTRQREAQGVSVSRRGPGL